MDATERSRLLRNLVVRVGDVRPGEAVRWIGMSTGKWVDGGEVEESVLPCEYN